MTFDIMPLLVSLRVALAATGIAFVLGIVAAGCLYSAHGAIRYITDVLFSLPLVLPPTVIGFILLLVFGKHGAVGNILAQLNIAFIFTPKAAVLAAATVSFPLMYRSALSAFSQVDIKLIYAARTLGMSELRIFMRVLLPLAWQGLVGGLVLTFARALGEFGATLMVAGNIAGRTETIPLAIYFATASGDMRTAAVWTVTITAVSCVMLAAVNAYTALRARKGGYAK